MNLTKEEQGYATFACLAVGTLIMAIVFAQLPEHYSVADIFERKPGLGFLAVLGAVVFFAPLWFGALLNHFRLKEKVRKELDQMNLK